MSKLNDPNSVWVKIPAKANMPNQFDSKRSFVTETSDPDHDISMVSNKSKKRKISPVFQDYGTAHSLITSGMAKNLTSPERKHFRSGSDDSIEQLQWMNKRRVNEKVASDVQISPVVSPVEEFERDFGNVRHGVLKGGDSDDESMSENPFSRSFAFEGNFGNVRHGVLKGGDEGDEAKSQIPKMQLHPSSPLEHNVREGVLKWDDDGSDGRISPLHDEASRIKRPQTPLGFFPKLWDMNATNSANRPPMMGGRLESVQWPSKNPYNPQSPFNILEKKSSGILSPIDDGFAKEIYSPSAYGTKNPFYSSPHGIPSPIASKSESGSFGEPRTSYPRSSWYPAEGIRDDLHSDANFEGSQMQKNIAYDQPSYYTQQTDNRRSRSGPQQGEGSTVNHILDHYTYAEDGSYYADGTKVTTAHSHQTPQSSRRLGLAQQGSAAVTPSTDEDNDSDLILRRFPNVLSPAYIGAASSSNLNYTTYGDSRELLGNYEQSERHGDSKLAPPQAPKSILKNRDVPPPSLGRQVSHALRDSTMYDDDSHIEVSSPVIKKPVAVQTKMNLRARKPIDGFQKVKNTDSSQVSSDDDETIRHQESSKEPNDDKENIPPTSNGIFSDGPVVVEEFRIETVPCKDGFVTRKISKRRPAPAPVEEDDDDDQDEWSTVIEESGNTSPGGRLPFSDDKHRARYKQTGSSTANHSDYHTSSPGALLGPYTVTNPALVHPARDNDQYEKHARPLGGGLPGVGSVYLPVPEQRRGGFATNAFRTPGKVIRTLSQHVSSPLGSSSPRHEYHELANIKTGASSPYSPPRDVKNRKGKDKAPMRQETPSQRAAREHGVRLAPWMQMDGPESSQGSANSASGFQFGLNQRPERPDSYVQMAKAANNGKLPTFMMSSSPSPDPQAPFEPYGDGSPHTPQLAYPPRAIHSTTESIADYSDDEASYIDSLDGPEYDDIPAQGVYNRANDARSAAGVISPQTDTTYADRSGVSQKPLAPGGLYSALAHNKLMERYNSKRRKSRSARRQAAEADLEAGMNEDVITIPQDTKRMRGFKLKPGPSVVGPRSRHEFQYRSPLAPLQDKEYEKMYSQGKLNRINNLRLHTEVVRPNIAHVTPNGTRMTSANAWQVAPVSPHLQGHQHEDSSFAGFAEQKEKISNRVLLLCAIPLNPFFPFLLLMYATGLLDWVIVKYTEGNVRRFGTRQKKSAAIIAGAYLAAIVVAFATVMAVKERQEAGH